MKLREALQSSNCGKAIHQVGAVYDNSIQVSFAFAEEDKWAPVMEKQIVKKTIVQWVNVYPSDEVLCYQTEERANKTAGPDRIACVKLSGEYEVEE